MLMWRPIEYSMPTSEEITTGPAPTGGDGTTEGLGQSVAAIASLIALVQGFGVRVHVGGPTQRIWCHALASKSDDFLNSAGGPTSSFCRRALGVRVRRPVREHTSETATRC
jgi:hypothetical protein